MSPVDNSPARHQNYLISFLFLLVAGGASCFLPPLVSAGIIAAILLAFSVFFRSFRAAPVFVLLFFILYGNLLKYFTGVRYALLFVDLFILLLFLKLVIEYCIRGRFPVFSPLVEFSFLAFYLISILELFNPNVPGIQAGLEGFRKTSFYMLGLVIGIDYIRSREQFEKALKLLVFFSLPIILYGIKQAFSMSAFDEKMVELNWSSVWTYRIYGWNRPIGLFSGPFHYAMLCIIVVLGSIHLFLENRKVGYILIIPVPIVGTLLAMTRTNLVALVGSLLLFVFLYFAYGRGFSKRKIFGYGLVFLLIALVIITIAASTLQPLSKSIASLTRWKEDRRFLNRVKVWEEIIESVARRPLLGYGMGSAGDTLEQIYDYPVHYTSHNLALKVVIETGVVGLFFYGLFFAGWFGAAYRGLHFPDPRFKNITILTVAVVSVLLINGLVGSAVEAFPINFITWFFMGAYLRLYAQEKASRLPLSGEVLPK